MYAKGCAFSRVCVCVCVTKKCLFTRVMVKIFAKRVHTAHSSTLLPEMCICLYLVLSCTASAILDVSIHAIVSLGSWGFIHNITVKNLALFRDFHAHHL